MTLWGWCAIKQTVCKMGFKNADAKAQAEEVGIFSMLLTLTLSGWDKELFEWPSYKGEKEARMNSENIFPVFFFLFFFFLFFFPTPKFFLISGMGLRNLPKWTWVMFSCCCNYPKLFNSRLLALPSVLSDHNVRVGLIWQHNLPLPWVATYVYFVVAFLDMWFGLLEKTVLHADHQNKVIKKKYSCLLTWLYSHQWLKFIIS